MKYSGQNIIILSLLEELKNKNIESFSLIENPSEVQKGDEKCLWICDQIEPEKIVEAIVQKNLNHVIQFSNFEFKDSFQRFLQNHGQRDLFFNQPMQAILGDVNPNELILKISKNSKKDDLLESIRTFLKTVPKMNSIRDSSLIVSHEMIINVIYDAPKYYEKKFGHVKNLTSYKDELGYFFICYNEEKMLIGAVDYFGSMDYQKMFNRLLETYQSKMVAVNLDPGGGAGLGCRMIFDLSTEIYFSLWPQNRTFVGAVLPLGVGYRKQQQIPKNVHIYNYK